MKINDITEPHHYHYSRTQRGVTITGHGQLIQRYEGVNGWYCIIHDVKNKRAPTLRPAHITKRVRTQ
jgi:hypothetical protein